MGKVHHSFYIPHCRGDEMGSFGGVKSGTVSDEVEPKKGAVGIKVAGKALVRMGY